MNSILLAAVALTIFFLGYRFYSKFIAEKIYRLDPKFKTPAHQFEDGRDFVPTNKWIVLGHHFTSVAGAAPIVGPAIAIYWGCPSRSTSIKSGVETSSQSQDPFQWY